MRDFFFGRHVEKKKLQLRRRAGSEFWIENWVYKRRAEAGLSAFQLAIRARCSVETIERIEGGRVNPGLELAMAIAVVLERPLTDVFRSHGAPKPKGVMPRSKRGRPLGSKDKVPRRKRG